MTLSTTGTVRWPSQPPGDKTAVAASVYCCPDVEYHPFAGDQ